MTMACAMPGRNAGRQRQAGERPQRSCTRLNAGNRSAYEGAHHRALGVGRSVGLADAGQSDALELEPEQPAQQLRLEIAWSNATIDEKDDSTSRRPSRGHKGGEAPRDSAARQRSAWGLAPLGTAWRRRAARRGARQVYERAPASRDVLPPWQHASHPRGRRPTPENHKAIKASDLPRAAGLAIAPRQRRAGGTQETEKRGNDVRA